MTITLHDYTPPVTGRAASALVRPASTGYPLAQPATKIPAPSVKAHPYYDYGPLLSHHAEWNFLVGGRGLGKTYGAKKLAIRRAIKSGDMFIYLRRYKEDLSKSRDTFFMDIGHEFPDWDFRVFGSIFQMSPVTAREDKKREWQAIGYAIALSTAQSLKSVAFPRVKLIIFDEFIIEKGVIKYIANEADVFKNFYSTVDRWQDKTTVLFLANAVSIANPYFIRYGIQPEADTEWMKLDVGRAKGYILCHFPDADAFASSVAKTRFGQMIDGTDYAEYAVGNQFADNTLALLGVKNPRARHMFNMETKAGQFSLWHDILIDEYYVHEKLPPGQRTVTFLVEKMNDDNILLLPSDLITKRIVSAFKHKRVKFENPMVRERWFTVMDDLL